MKQKGQICVKLLHDPSTNQLQDASRKQSNTGGHKHEYFKTRIGKSTEVIRNKTWNISSTRSGPVVSWIVD